MPLELELIPAGTRVEANGDGTIKHSGAGGDNALGGAAKACHLAEQPVKRHRRISQPNHRADARKTQHCDEAMLAGLRTR